MRFLVFSLAFCAIFTYCLANRPKHDVSEDNYLELVREIEDEIAKENELKHEAREKDNLEQAREENGQEKAIVGNYDEPPYTDKEISYLQLAREVSDQYMEEIRRENEESENVGARTASDSLRAFSHPSRRTQMLAEENERQDAELETLQMLASGENLRMRNLPDLTAKTVQDDPTCNTKLDCEGKNLNLVDGKEFRTITGTCNNKLNYTWGMAGAQHRRLLPNAYNDGKWKIRKLSVTSRPRKKVFLPSARKISNVVHKTTKPKPENEDSISLGLFYFMQFIDHDLAKTAEGHVRKKKICCKTPTKATKFCLPIVVEESDDQFDKDDCMESRRSFVVYRCNDNVRNQINEITSYLDASMVYGSSEEEEDTLRTKKAGLLKMSTEDFLPISERATSLPCNATDVSTCYEAGDTRANVHPGLLTYHTVFAREHNRIAKELRKVNSGWSDERLYQETRKIVGGEIQHIVYTHMLPVLIQDSVLDQHGVTKEYDYKDSVDASMTAAFSMVYRYHNLMPHKLNLGRLKGDGVETFEQFNQESVFQKPSFVTRDNYDGINEVTLGMIQSQCPYVNRFMNAAARDLLFLDKNGNSFDLVALNIMRGRDWGTPSYTAYRALCGLGIATTWNDLTNTTDQEDIDKMKEVYADVQDVDLWTGVMTEKKLAGSISGATQSCLLAMHFANIKHGDRFWYEGSFSEDQLEEIKKITLARVLCDTLEDITLMRENVFRTNSDWKRCSDIEGKIDFSKWQE
ncbi:peroxidase mlt-7-like [Mercenaria mercenaria]|uniref:peroxidase mlt-7-like n=1 Tax=Mercenaria mercenaria TaxID=6596 RepID=UPI00234F0409|nr:peroxidase mlt-7-like [Mercenaria mercenaria]